MDNQKKMMPRYQYFSSMSNEKLQHLLQLDFQALEELLTNEDISIISNILSTRLDTAYQDEFPIEEKWTDFLTDVLPNADAKILDTLEELECTEFDVEKNLKDFKEQYLPLLQAQNSEKTIIQKHPHKKFTWNKKRCVGIAAVCFVMISFSVTANANGLFSKMAHWTDDIFHFDNSEEIKTASKYNSSQNSLNLKEIFQVTQDLPNVIPIWIPYSMRATEYQYFDRQDKKYLNIVYENIDTSNYVQFFIKYAPIPSETLYEKDTTPVTIWQKDGVDYYFMQNLDFQTVVWRNGPLECQLSGTVSHDDLKKMIDSIPT